MTKPKPEKLPVGARLEMALRALRKAENNVQAIKEMFLRPVSPNELLMWLNATLRDVRAAQKEIEHGTPKNGIGAP